MSDEFDLLDDGTDVVYKGKRPVFLQVLCILTFVGAGLGIIYSLFSMMAISAAERMMNGFSSITQDMPEVDDTFANIYRWAKWSLYASILGNVACLVGALIMWRLKKIGYYIYIVGQGLPLIIGLFYYFAAFGNEGIGGGFLTSFGIVGIVIQAVFPIGFIVMYGLNYKYMK